MKFTNSYTFLEIELERNDIFRDAFYIIMTKSPQELKKRPIIRYKGEEGVDAGGLLRYYYYYYYYYYHYYYYYYY